MNMRSIGPRSILFPSLLHVAMTVVHQNCVSSPPLAEAFNGLIWDKNSGEFVKILSIESFAKIEREFSSISRELETHNFRGASLRMTAFAIEGLIGFETNEFNETVATGIHAEMWQILARMSNFKILTIESKDTEFGTRNDTTGDWNGFMGYIYRNETDIIPRCVVEPKHLSALDYTLTVWRSKHKYYMKEQFRPQKAWMVSLFSRRVWLSIVVLFFALVFASHTIHVCNFKYNGRARDSVTDFKDHLFYTFSIFCVQGWLPSTLDKHSKILLLSTRLLAWLLFIAFGAKLISQITTNHSPVPFTGIDSFYHETDFKLVVERNSYIASILRNSAKQVIRQISNSGRVIEANTSELQDILCAGNNVYVETEDVAEAMRFKRCNYYTVTESNLTRSITSGLVRGFKYKKTINLGILKLHEYGIINYLRIKWLKNLQKVKTSTDPFESLAIENVVLIFAVLLSGIVLSLTVLLLENIMIFLKLRQYRFRRTYYEYR